LRFCAQKLGMSMPEDIRDDGAARLKTKILEMNRIAARYFYSVLMSKKGSDGLKYIKERRLSPETVKSFGIGYAPNDWNCLCDFLLDKGFSKEEIIAAQLGREGKNGGVYDLFRGRVMFPIIDIKGAVIGFGGRILNNDKPKYLNSSDTPVFKKSRNLFGLNKAKGTKAENLILTEGYMDTVSLHQAGFDNVIATLGTALTSEQARLISAYTSEIIVSYDSDEAGRKATERAVNIFSELGISVRVLNMQGAKDPDEYIKVRGVEAFKTLIKESPSSTENKILSLKKKYNIETDDGKVKFLNEFCMLASEIKDRMTCEVYTAKIANELNVSAEAISEKIKFIRKNAAQKDKKKFDNAISAYPERSTFAKDPERLKFYKYARCEDKLLAFLFKNPDSFNDIYKLITPNEFVTGANRSIYEALFSVHNAHEIPDLTVLSAYLPTEQVSRLSGILAENQEKNVTVQTAKELAEVICSQKNEKTENEIVDMDMDELHKYIDKLSANKK
ncbi:MAG: DNA primase, partial [Oscillospiraceae bacterium]